MKLAIGFIVGLLPVIILHLAPVGLPLYNPTDVATLLIMGLSGAAVPLVQRLIQRWEMF